MLQIKQVSLQFPAEKQNARVKKTKFDRQTVPDGWAVYSEGSCAVGRRSEARDLQCPGVSRPKVTPTGQWRGECAVVDEVGRFGAMEALVDECRDLEFDAPTDRQPVKVTQDWADVVELPGPRDEPSRRVLDWLQLRQQTAWSASEQTVAIVNPATDKRSDERLNGLCGERIPCHSDLSQLKKAGPLEWGHVVGHVQLYARCCFWHPFLICYEL